MYPETELWVWCLRGVYAGMVNEVAQAWFVGQRQFIVAVFDFTWNARGGISGSPEYEAFIWTFRFEEIEVIVGGEPIAVYLPDTSVWNDITDVVIATPPDDRVCKMPDWK